MQVRGPLQSIEQKSNGSLAVSSAAPTLLRLSCSPEYTAEAIACYWLTGIPYAVQRPWGVLTSAYCRPACVVLQSSPELGPPSEFDQTSAAGRSSQQLSWGFVLFSATEPEGFTKYGALPISPLRSAYRVSHPPDGLHPLRPTRPCLMPGTLLRFSLRGIPPLTSRTLLRAVAPSPLKKRARTTNRSQRIRNTNLLDLEALLPSGIRTSKSRYYPELRPMPPWDSAPLRLSPSQPGPLDQPFRSQPWKRTPRNNEP